MKIKIDESKGAFKSEDLKYLELLSEDKDFWELIKKARIACGSDIKFYLNYPNDKVYAMAYKHAKDIADIYSIPDSWISSMSDFLVMGEFSYPGLSIFKSGLSLKQNTGHATTLTISVTQKTSYSALKKWVESNQKVLQEHLKKLPPHNSKREKSFEWRLEAFKLRRQGKKLKEIADELDKKYKDDSEYPTPSETDIARWVSRLEKALKHYSER